MAVSFKCKASGNIITFAHEVDIITTRDNPAYEEIIEVAVVEEPVVVKKTVVKKTAKVEE